MWEVGERYAATLAALERSSYALARHHWEEIRTTIQNGYLKRLARRANSERLFLDAKWQYVLELLSSGDTEAAWQSFDRARAACMQCHVAELVPYINDQPVFEFARLRSRVLHLRAIKLMDAKIVYVVYYLWTCHAIGDSERRLATRESTRYIAAPSQKSEFK